MKKSPAFQFYPTDYLASQRVQMMTLEEEGAYIRLLAYCWKHGDIPADPDQAARLIGKGASTTLATTVLTMFQPMGDSGRMTHDRLESEREKQATWREKSSIGGKKSAEKRKGGSTTVQPPLEGCLKNATNQNATLLSSSSSSNNKEPQVAIPLPFDSNEFKTAWEEWLTHKREIKQKMPPTTIKGQLAKCEKWGEAKSIQAIQNSISAKWQGLFEPKTETPQQRPLYDTPTYVKNGTSEHRPLWD